jgi:hypothetical protein
MSDDEEALRKLDYRKVGEALSPLRAARYSVSKSAFSGVATQQCSSIAPREG